MMGNGEQAGLESETLVSPLAIPLVLLRRDKGLKGTAMTFT